MITRDLGPRWQAGCANAPPPLHIMGATGEQSWFPVERLALVPQPPGPVMVTAPPSIPFGDDPTDPTAQTEPRIPTTGIVGRLHPRSQP